MNFSIPVPVKELVNKFNLELIGDEHQMATGINEIHKVRPGDITFVDVEKYYEKSLNSAATIIIINKKVACPVGKSLLISDDPFAVDRKSVV